MQMAHDDGAYRCVRALVIDSLSEPSSLDAFSTELLRHADGNPAFWSALVGETEYHGVVAFVLPLVSALAVETPDLVPRNALRALGALAHRQRRAFEARERLVDRILSSLGEAGIEVLLLKGGAVAHLIYARPEYRPMVDIDLLVRPGDIEAAARLLRALGFVFAESHDSRFAGRRHHLPPAWIEESGFPISVEVHHQALSHDFGKSITLASLTTPKQVVRRGNGPAAFALGHIDMLRHLCHHAFGPAARVRLKHLLDLRLYRSVFASEIDWAAMRRHFPEVQAILDVAELAFCEREGPQEEGVGAGMLPLAEILASDIGVAGKLNAAFNPPDWWLRGRYGIPPNRSLWACKVIRHPANMGRWIGRRLIGYLDRRDPMKTD